MQYFGISDIGKKRKENQDKIFLPKDDNEFKLFILADGMGGAKAGSVATGRCGKLLRKLGAGTHRTQRFGPAQVVPHFRHDCRRSVGFALTLFHIVRFGVA